MPSLERFFNPQTRPLSLNITSLPGARLYFFSAGTTTPKVTYQDKQGEVESTNPVIADSSGIFPQIFLDGLYRVELRSSANIVQPGWPIDNVGQDSAIVPFAAWSEIVTYQEFEVVSDPLTGDWYRSLADDNVGNDPTTSPSFWDSLVSPVASNFISDADWLSFASEPGKISLNANELLLSQNLSTYVGYTKCALRTANKEIASSSTFETDSDLTISGLENDAWYSVKAMLRLRGGGITTNGFKLRVACLSGQIPFMLCSSVNTTSTTTPTALVTTWNTLTGIEKNFNASNSLEPVIVEALIKVETGNSIYVQWAQSLASATATVCSEGFISVTRIA